MTAQRAASLRRLLILAALCLGMFSLFEWVIALSDGSVDRTTPEYTHWWKPLRIVEFLLGVIVVGGAAAGLFQGRGSKASRARLPFERMVGGVCIVAGAASLFVYDQMDAAYLHRITIPQWTAIGFASVGLVIVALSLLPHRLAGRSSIQLPHFTSTAKSPPAPALRTLRRP